MPLLSVSALTRLPVSLTKEEMMNPLLELLTGGGINPDDSDLGLGVPDAVGDKTPSRMEELLIGNLNPAQEQQVSAEEEARVTGEKARALQLERIGKMIRPTGGIGVKGGWKAMTKGERAASVFQALADVGAGAFGVQSNSIERTADRNRAADQAYRDKSMQFENLRMQNTVTDAQAKAEVAKTIASFNIQNDKDARAFVQTLISSSPPKAFYEDSLENPDSKEKAITSIGFLSPEEQPRAKQLMNAHWALGKQEYEEEIDGIRKDVGEKTATLMAKPENQRGEINPMSDPEAFEMPGPNGINKKVSGVEYLADAKTREEVIKRGNLVLAEVSNRAQRSMGAGKDGADPVAKQQILDQRALLAEARKKGVDFAAYSGPGTGPLVHDKKTGLMSDDAYFWLSNEVARHTSADPKLMVSNLASFKQGIQKAIPNIKQDVKAAIKDGKTFEMFEVELQSAIESDLGLIGKWKSEADGLMKQYLEALRAEFDIQEAANDRDVAARKEKDKKSADSVKKQIERNMDKR